MTKAATLDIGEMLRGRAAGLKITTSENAGPVVVRIYRYVVQTLFREELLLLL